MKRRPARTTAALLTAGSAALVMAFGPTSSSTAAPAIGATALTGAQLSQKMLGWQRQGKTAVEIDKALEPYGFDVVQPAKYDRIAARREALARSGASDVSLSAPFIIHDAGARWYWSANYSWDNTDFSNDMPITCNGYDNCNLYGKDGFGIAFDRKLDIRGYWATFGYRSSSLPSDRILDPAERNAYGVVYKKQDTVYKPSTPNDLDMYYGNVMVEIDGRPCNTTNAWSKLAHTWGEESIPSITIGSGFISYTFGGEGSKWTHVSQPGSNTHNC